MPLVPPCFRRLWLYRILALRTPEVTSMLKETDNDVAFATDMEEPVCEGSEEHNHQQEHPHGITVVFFGFLRIIIRLDNSLKLVLNVVSNTEQLSRNF